MPALSIITPQGARIGAGGRAAVGGAYGLNLAGINPTILRPILAASTSNPAAASAVTGMSDSQVTQLAGQVQNAAPAVGAAVTNPTPGNNAAAAAAAGGSSLAIDIAATLIATGEGAKWGVTPALDPQSAVTRKAGRPVKVIGSSPVLDANGNGVCTFLPQEPFEAFRLVVPSGQASLPAYVSNLLAGDRLMVTQSGRMPAACLSEKSDAGRIDFPLVQLGEQIVLNVTGGVATKEFSAVLMGYGSRPRVLPDGSEILYQRIEPFDVTVDGAGATATINLQPQRNIIIRRLCFDDTQANFASVYQTFFNVQDIPQMVGSTEFPLQLWSELAQDDWVDMDMCQLGGLISIGLRNAAAGACNVQGYALCDVVRLPNEIRR